MTPRGALLEVGCRVPAAIFTSGFFGAMPMPSVPVMSGSWPESTQDDGLALVMGRQYPSRRSVACHGVEWSAFACDVISIDTLEDDRAAMA